MCRGCFGQLLLRDEFHSNGIAGLLGKAAGMPTRRAFMAYSVAAASALPEFGAAPAFAADDGADLISAGRDDPSAAGRAGRLGARDQGRQGACGRRRERAVGPQDGATPGRRSRAAARCCRGSSIRIATRSRPR